MTPTCTEEGASQEAKNTTVDTCGGIIEYEQDNGKIKNIHLVLNNNHSGKLTISSEWMNHQCSYGAARAAKKTLKYLGDAGFASGGWNVMVRF